MTDPITIGESTTEIASFKNSLRPEVAQAGVFPCATVARQVKFNVLCRL
jgi:hypothetical protein